ncbi:39S ribosomal protein l39, mitochondrial-like [Plakobranchus ocellatus]|uniref:39S ribosomal protein l39, mitochondrial-like n=1 Tax=Plakobranchus ocellatus TaxID=259542 RepID=A0AAV4CP35_9GAST|nr:39S ribosomal protein l39, mitochondrial-like [Plakobranchus ocellatus]
MATAIHNFQFVVRLSMSNGIRRICRRAYSTRKLTNAEVRRKRVELFDAEKQRQLALVTRVEKIEVRHKGVPEECTLIMNKDLSTPFNCAMHIHELLMNRSALALVNGEPWDMHRPLERDCELRFLHFQDEDSRVLNNAFWRTCAFILGHVLETAFKDEYYVELCSFPPPNVSSGSFVYDAALNIGDWQLSQTELNCLSRIGYRLSYADLKIQRLEVPVSVADQMFADNRFKQEQVSAIAAKSKSGATVTLYRAGDHVDLSSGPMIGSTAQIGRYSVCAVHDIESPTFGKLQRVQGLALPTQLTMHSWTYDTILRPRAAKLNTGPLPEMRKTQTPKELPAP